MCLKIAKRLKKISLTIFKEVVIDFFLGKTAGFFYDITIRCNNL